MTELDGCRSLTEAARITTRVLVEDFDATGAAIFDREGPIVAHPVQIPAGLIAALGEVRAGAGAWSPVEIDGGLAAISYRIARAEGARIAAAWKPGAGAAERVRTVADILSAWFEDVGPGGTRDPGSGIKRENGLLDGEDFANLIETIPALVYMAEMGECGRWHYVSPQIETILGYTPEEWIADPTLWYRSIHPDDLEHALAFEDKRLVGLDLHPPAEYRMRTRDGRAIWIYERARLIHDRDGAPIWHGVIQDVTARKQAEIDLARKVEQQALLAKLGEMAVGGDDPDRLLNTAIQRITGLDRVLEASIWEQVDDHHLSLLARSGGLGWATLVPFAADRFPGDRLVRGEPVLFPSWSGDERLGPYREFIPPEVASSFAVPILGNRRQFGIILVHSDQRDAFTPEDADFLLAAAGMLGNAILRHQADRSLHHRINHDALTELPNRRYFETRLGEVLTAAAGSATVAVIFLDLDHFKLINDGVGHGAGDEVLQVVAMRLLGCVRQNDTVARFGGDEFGVVLPAVADAGEAAEAAERILTAVSEPVRVEGAERRITASAGISLRGPDGGDSRSAGEMIREADAAMYSAKEAGRAQIRHFDRSIQRKVVQRLEIERELHDAIERDELVLLYQPIIDLGNGHLTGFEALVRWAHPTEGLLGPDRFLPVAQESELIRKIDTWVLRRAVETLDSWNRELPAGRELGISVNFSARQLADGDLIDLVAGLLSRRRLLPRLLTVELTETSLLSGSRLVTATVEQLDRLGVRLSLDDFGTGFSSLGYLGEFPLDEIKIDRKFIEFLGEGDLRGSAIADAIIRIGTALSMTVVAEAVTSTATLEVIRGMGCHRAQGYLIAPPLEITEATGLALDPGPAYPVGADSDAGSFSRG